MIIRILANHDESCAIEESDLTKDVYCILYVYNFHYIHYRPYILIIYNYIIDFTTPWKGPWDSMFSIKDALEKMIHEDLPQLLKLTTEEAASAEAASMAQLGTGASPFAVMKVGGSVGLGRWIGQPFRLFQSFPGWWTCCQCCPSNMTSFLGLVGSNYGFVEFYFSPVAGARSPHFYRIVYHAPVKRTLLTWDSSSRLGIKIACLYTF